MLSGPAGAPYACWNAKTGVFVAAVHPDGSLGPRLKLAGRDADNRSVRIAGNGDGIASWRSNGRIQHGAGNGYRMYVTPFTAPPT